MEADGYIAFDVVNRGWRVMWRCVPFLGVKTYRVVEYREP